MKKRLRIKNCKRKRLIGGGNLWTSIGGFFKRLFPSLLNFGKTQIALHAPNVLESGRKAAKQLVTNVIDQATDKGMQTLMNKLQNVTSDKSNQPTVSGSGSSPAVTTDTTTTVTTDTRNNLVNLSLTLSDTQMDKLSSALKSGDGCTLKFSYSDLTSSPSDIKQMIGFTQSQVDKIHNAVKCKKGVLIKFTRKQLRLNKLIKGGFIGALIAGLASALLPSLFGGNIGDVVASKMSGAVASKMSLEFGGMKRV